MLKILFKTFPVGHLVSDKEYARLKKGFTKVGMELVRDGEEYDILMVKGFSHTWAEIPHDKPVTYLSIGTEWKVNATLELNEPIRELYEKANAVVHISEYCMKSHWAIFPNATVQECVIIPACEPMLGEIKPMHEPLKLALTSHGDRPVKRIDDVKRLCEKYGIQLELAMGSTDDFSYYHDCDGYIQLSRKEGMPNSVLEALAYGLPCIVTNYGGASEAVGDAGIIIKNDPEDVAWNPDNILPVDEILFADAIKKFKENYYDLRIKVRERVLSELNDYVCACQFKEIYENILLCK